MIIATPIIGAPGAINGPGSECCSSVTGIVVQVLTPN